jgi:uncharacterized low-complexity protein
MKTKKNLASVVLGAAIMSTTAFAGMNGSCGSNMKETKEMTKNGNSDEMMKVKGGCGAGKCGSDMKKSKDVDNDEMMKKKKKMMEEKSEMKAKGSCGSGKCGAM